MRKLLFSAAMGLILAAGGIAVVGTQQAEAQTRSQAQPAPGYYADPWGEVERQRQLEAQRTPSAAAPPPGYAAAPRPEAETWERPYGYGYYWDDWYLGAVPEAWRHSHVLPE